MTVAKCGLNRLTTSACALDEQAFALIAPSEGLLSSEGGLSFSALTIALLPHGEPLHLRRMLGALTTHIPEYRGELVILTREDSATDMDALVASRWPEADFRKVVTTADLAEGDALNLAIGAATRRWIWFLDPRTILSWNPLTMAEEDLRSSGTHFLNLPRVTAAGECSSSYRIAVECHNGSMKLLRARDYSGACFAASDQTSSYTMGIDSAALIARLDTLREVGGFPAGASACEADLDLARRLYAKGCKIAVCRAVAIYEGDLSAASDSSGQPALTVSEEIRGAAGYLAPYGLNASVHQSADGVHAGHSFSRTRPKIALVIDVDNWAFGNIARQLCRYLSDRFEFIVIPIGIVKNPVRVLLLARDCELIHYFWREDPVQLNTPYAREYALSLGFRWDDFYTQFVARKAITTSVYDHLLLDQNDLDQRRALYTDLLAGYTVSSKRLDSIYRNVEGYPAPNIVAEDGVDLTLFKPKRIERLASVAERRLVIGWAGNSKWEADREDFKGLHTILQPAVDELVREGYPVTTNYADRQVRFIPHTEMPDYYSTIDVYVCPSKIEGTPNPVLESMACGVPVISTDVGVVPQVFGPLQQEFILQERSTDALKAVIIRLLQQPQLLIDLSQENLESIKSWDWAVKAENFSRFFQMVLKWRSSLDA